MSMDSPVITLTRDVEAIQIPSGLTKKLQKGTPVIITQSLGGTYTVVVEHSAGLFRVLAEDADALGKIPAPAGNNGAPVANPGGPLNEDDVWTQLKTCYDPEIPVNIVDLGLIYSLEIKPQEGGGNLVEVKMTLTAPGCGMGPSIASDAQRKDSDCPRCDRRAGRRGVGPAVERRADFAGRQGEAGDDLTARMNPLLKIAISAVLIWAITEISRRSSNFAALVASLPLVSLLSMIWIYHDPQDPHNVTRIAQFSWSVVWYVIPSLLLFILLPPLLIRWQMPFYGALALAGTATVAAFLS